MKQIYFVRHGQTEWNAIRRMQGQWNSDLSALGRQQADEGGRFLASQGIERIYVSPLDRTRQTADLIGRHVPVPQVIDERIMEWDCGDWSGHLYDDVKVRWADEWAALEANRFHYRGPNCENYPDMIDRAGPFLTEVLAAEDTCIAVVSHGMIGRVMVAQLLGLGEEETLAFHQQNDVIFRVTVTEGGTEVCHFIGGNGPHPGLHNEI